VQGLRPVWRLGFLELARRWECDSEPIKNIMNWLISFCCPRFCFGIRAGFLSFALLGNSAQAQIVATYTESSLPPNLVLKPGITRITGGLTTAGETDHFLFQNTFSYGTAAASLKAKVSYNHQSGNVIQGVPEHPHLLSTIATGVDAGGGTFEVRDSTTLGSPFYLQNGANSIQGTVIFDYDLGQLSISVPPGKTNPTYTADVELILPADSHEGVSGNNSVTEATVINPAVARSIFGGFHTTVDEDWFRFDVPAGKTLRIRLERYSQSDAALYPLSSSLLNDSVVPLQTSTLADTTYVETAAPGGSSYFLHLRSPGGYGLGWIITYSLDDVFEPNNSFNESGFIGSLSENLRIEHPDLNVTAGNDDYYYLEAGTSFTGPVYLIVHPEVSNAAISLSISGPGVSFVRGNYARLVFASFQGMEFRVSGVGNYRLVVKRESGYDTWQDALHAFPGAEYTPSRSDEDGDGVPAALEWALRRSPFLHEPSSISAPYLSGGHWKVNLIMPQGGTAAPIRIRESTDLASWTDLDSARSNTGGAVVPPGRTSGVVVTMTRPGVTENFLRFEVDD
jgi:hypothetical protein